MTFNLTEEEPFLRTLLDDPSDTFTRAVYADWLEERGDIRSAYLRTEIAEDFEGYVPLVSGSYPHPGEFDAEIDSRWPWLAFIETLGNPFYEIKPDDEVLGIDPVYLPLTEPLGHRGPVVTFASQFRDQSCWDAELLTDLMLLCSLQAELPESGGYTMFMSPFLCEIQPRSSFLAADEVLAALKPEHRPSELGPIVKLDEDFSGQDLFVKNRSEVRRTDPIGPDAGNHGLLQRYVDSGRMWYAQFSSTLTRTMPALLFAVGLSPSHRRMLGVVTVREDLTEVE